MRERRPPAPDPRVGYRAVRSTPDSQDDDWNELIGLRRGIVYLVVRALIWMPIWGVIFWLTIPVLNQLPMPYSMVGIGLWTAGVAIPFGILGIGMAATLCRHLVDIAGMASLVLLVLAILIGVTSILGALWTVWLFQPSTNWTHLSLSLGGPLLYGLFALRWAWLEHI